MRLPPWSKYETVLSFSPAPHTSPVDPAGTSQRTPITHHRYFAPNFQIPTLPCDLYLNPRTVITPCIPHPACDLTKAHVFFAWNQPQAVPTNVAWIGARMSDENL